MGQAQPGDLRAAQGLQVRNVLVVNGQLGQVRQSLDIFQRRNAPVLLKQAALLEIIEIGVIILSPEPELPLVLINLLPLITY